MLMVTLFMSCRATNQVLPTVTSMDEPASETTPLASPTSSITVTFTPVPATPKVIVTPTPVPSLETPVEGEIILSPGQGCQMVPEPELLDNVSDDVHLAGIFYLCRQWPLNAPLITFDLDTGLAGNRLNLDSDLEFGVLHSQIDNSFYYHIRSTNGSLIFETEEENPTITHCRLVISDRGGRIIDAFEGTRACMLTNDGRIAYIRVEQHDPYGWASIAVYFETWEK